MDNKLQGNDYFTKFLFIFVSMFYPGLKLSFNLVMLLTKKNSTGIPTVMSALVLRKPPCKILVTAKKKVSG